MIENYLIAIIQNASYPTILILAILEGPITNFIASMSAGAGFLNIYLVATIAVLGDIIGDTIHYFIGRKIGKKGKLRKNKLNIKYNFIKNHFTTSLFLIKIIPGLASPGLIYLGYKKINFKKFLTNTILICLLLDIPISILGYSFVIGLNTFIKYYHSTQSLIIFSVVFIGIILLIRTTIRKIIKSKFIH
jgi:membrane-associated protein